MANISKVKNNIAKMIEQGAPESDIDAYVSMEGTSPEELRSKKAVPVKKKKDSMATMGVLKYAKEHPFKTILQPALETATGKGVQDRALDVYWDKSTEAAAKMTPLQQKVHNALMIPGGMAVSAAGLGADVLTSPITLATAGLGALKPVQKVGSAIAKTKGAQALGRFATKQRSVVPKIISRSAKKYKMLRKGSEFKGIRTDMSASQRVKNLEKIAKEKYNKPITAHQRAMNEGIDDIILEEKKVISDIQSRIATNKEKLKTDVSSLSEKMKKNLGTQEREITLMSQKAAAEGKRRYSSFARENSTSYGNKLDDVIDIAEQEGNVFTRGDLKKIFTETDDEIAAAFIDEGVPLSRYNAFKKKYLGDEELIGGLQEKMKGSGIDWSRVDIEASSGLNLPKSDEAIVLKELMNDVRKITKSISSKGKGSERAFVQEDLAAIIFQKNIGKKLASKYEDFGKLQKEYAPIIEQMKAGRKLFKPGSPYDLGTAPSKIINPDILERRLIDELESGTQGFSRGLGKITKPVTKAQQKLTGTKRGIETAKIKIENYSKSEQRQLQELLEIKEQAFALAKKNVTKKGIEAQNLLKDQLNKRLNDLRTGQFKGATTISKLEKRAGVTGKEKRALSGGGLLTEVSYLIRRVIARGLLR